MSLRTSPVLVSIRSLGRKLGLNSLLARVVLPKGYEAAFDNALFESIQPGDTVWDIGANVGLYTDKFADWAGPGGHVVSFEPNPATAERLHSQVGARPNVTIIPVGLGAHAGEFRMAGGSDALAATSRVVHDGDAAGTIVVQIETADEVLADGRAPEPNVAKIDVEGFELDVLQGMDEILSRESLRAIGIEVHFGILAERGLKGAPATIESLLKQAGFAVQWVDPSHIFARRVRRA